MGDRSGRLLTNPHVVCLSHILSFATDRVISDLVCPVQ